LRELHARPSGSRTIGNARISTGRQGEVGHEASDDRDLLEVLEAEVGDVGRDDAEQPRDDRGHALEVTGPRRAVEADRDGPRVDGGPEPEGVHLLDGRREQDVDAEVGGQVGVGPLVPRVALEVLAVTELGRVDEQRHHDEVAFLQRRPHQAEVALVEGTHRGDEADAAPLLAREVQRRAHLTDGAERPHRAIAGSCVPPRSGTTRAAASGSTSEAVCNADVR
jgi:hypothetical protein